MNLEDTDLSQMTYMGLGNFFVAHPFVIDIMEKGTVLYTARYPDNEELPEMIREIDIDEWSYFPSIEVYNVVLTTEQTNALLEAFENIQVKKGLL